MKTSCGIEDGGNSKRFSFQQTKLLGLANS